ncbi:MULTISPECIES: hypothetical protein [unclassified Amycolatopsis]|uniref:hypothetical protein n=1 Tax=unclassified Amycolatopsis TaxID=2618356 RepID=UPI002E1D7D77|nr:MULTISPECIES: hypothetical protein [unclassified Amycolatopsis]
MLTLTAALTSPAQNKSQSSAETRRPPVTLQEALTDPDPLIRYQARRQHAYESGELVLDSDLVTLDRMVEIWQRNRDCLREHRLRAAESRRTAPRAGRKG